MFLRRYDASAIDPLFLVNRQAELDWLYGTLSTYLTDPDPTARGRLAFCILGEKGVGKTILTRAALYRARQDYSDRALFLEVDCRRHRSARHVIDAIAMAKVTALYDMKATGTAVSNELLATAQVLATITRFEEADLRDIHQYVEPFKVAANLKGDHALLKALNLSFQVSIERSSSTRDLAGKVRFDEPRLCDALSSLFHDIRAGGLDVVLYLDNMDELSHHYSTADELQKVRSDTEVLLRLHAAPIILVLNMRTYYSGILPREIANRRVLRNLPVPELLLVLDKRLEGELPAVKQRVEEATTRDATRRLADMAPTPLAFLSWFKTMFEEDALSVEAHASGATRFLDTFYSTTPEAVWKSIADAFATPDSAITREALLGACARNEALLRQAVDHQGVLPKDFWDLTTCYTLDPELYLIHPRATSTERK
jgi:Cdc6-like AAA superfamily ATPase